MLSIPGCTAPPLDREQNDRLIARCYAKARPEVYKARGGETAASVLEIYYDYLAPYLVSDALGRIARENGYEPRSVLAEGADLKLPPPEKLLRPDLKVTSIAPRETGLILEAWDKYRVHECGLVDIIMGHEQKNGAAKIDLPLPRRLVTISRAGSTSLKSAVEGLEKKRVNGAPPEKALEILRSIGFAAGDSGSYHYEQAGLKVSKELDTGLQKFALAIRDMEAWAGSN